jgi:hypothetical protein
MRKQERVNDAENRLTVAEIEIEELRLAAANWEITEQRIWQMAEDWARCKELAEALSIEDILIERVPLDRRWMLDRLFSAIRKIDKDLDE